MSNYLGRKNVHFALVAGTLGCLALGALLMALAERQQSSAADATWWTRAAIFLLIALLVFTLPKIVRLVIPEAAHFQFPFQVPAIGLAYGAFVAVVMLAAFSTGNNLLYLIFSLLLALLVVSVLAARLNLTRLDLDLQAPLHLFAGETAPLELTFTNRKRLLPSFSLTVKLKDSHPAASRADRQTANQIGKQAIEQAAEQAVEQVAAAVAENRALAFVAIVPPRAQARVRATHTFTRRGVYALENLLVVTRFPFGLLERSYALDSQSELVVYPTAPPLSRDERNLPFALGQLPSLRKGNGSDLYAIRSYQPTDHRHAIDWKATAKTARLMVREFTREDDWRVTVWFDIQAGVQTSAEDSERYERAISLTASLLEHFIAEGAEVRLLLGEQDLGYGSTRAHWYAMLRELARLPVPSATAPAATSAAMMAESSAPSVLGNEFTIWLTSAPTPAVPAGAQGQTLVLRLAEL